jgi:protein gp37
VLPWLASHTHRSKTVYTGVTKVLRGRRVWEKNLTASPDGDQMWTLPLTHPGVVNPALGPGKPNLIFVVVTGDLFVEGRPIKDINRTVETVALSDHIGLLVTKYTQQLVAYFAKQSVRTVECWQRNLWLGFSAERQQEFDQRWSDIRPFAVTGWRTLVSIAPILEPVTLPPEFLALGPRTWVIVNGEEAKHNRCRPLDASWARAIRDQCAVAGIAFFMKGMHTGAPIPPDLQIRQFPVV